MNGKGQACYSNGNKQKKNHSYQKNICDHKRIFCSYLPVSPLASPTRKEKLREREEERKKIQEEAGRETERILLTCHSTTLAFN